MGSYGIAPTRLMGIIAELLSDGKGLAWPEAVAPYRVHLVSLVPNDETVAAYADALYEELAAAASRRCTTTAMRAPARSSRTPTSSAYRTASS